MTNDTLGAHYGNLASLGFPLTMARNNPAYVCSELCIVCDPRPTEELLDLIPHPPTAGWEGASQLGAAEPHVGDRVARLLRLRAVRGCVDTHDVRPGASVWYCGLSLPAPGVLCVPEAQGKHAPGALSHRTRTRS